jgi:hypothetical protein
MAISMPRYPTNPYTNLPWSIAQLGTLYDQMQACLWNVGRQFLDPVAQAFYTSHLHLQTFRQAFGPTLEVECARRFFCDTTSEHWELLYGETLEEMFVLFNPHNPMQLKHLLLHRNFSKNFLREWDDMVLGFWCYDNLNRVVLPDICSIYDMINEAKKLMHRTQKIIKEGIAARKKNMCKS